MAEKIVSPGVFTRERDLSFLPQGVSEIGACIIGSTRKGPAFVPTLVESMADFETIFGSVWEDSYVPYTAQQYLKSAGRVTIVRVLGERGHANYKQIAFVLGESTAGTTAVGTADLEGYLPTTAGKIYKITDVAGNEWTFESDVSPASTDIPSARYYFFSTGSDAATSIANLAAEINSTADVPYIATVTGSSGGNTLELSASAAGANGNTITFSSGSHAADKTLTLAGGANALGGTVIGVSAPVKGEVPGVDNPNQYSGKTYQAGSQVEFSDSSTMHASSTGKVSHLTLTSNVAFSVDGAAANATHTYTGSFDYTDNSAWTNIFGRDVNGNQPLYLRSWFKEAAKELTDGDSGISASIQVSNLDWTHVDYKTYTEASTPPILSQDGATLFKVKTLSHGDVSNTEIKIAITNIKWPGAVAGSDYGSFNLQVRKYDDTDLKPVILEQYNNVSLDPNLTTYYPKMIGDRYMTVDSSGKITLNGDWGNKSKYIRVSDYQAAAALVNHIPWGFGKYKVPFDTETSYTNDIPTASMVVSQSDGTQYNSRVMFGTQFGGDTAEYFTSIPRGPSQDDSGSYGANVNFTLEGKHSNGNELVYGNAASCSLASRQFGVGFQGGYDGFAPMRVVQKGSDIGSYTQGWWLGVSDSTTDYPSFTKAIDAVSNPDEFDINMLVIPGVDATNHAGTVTYAKNMCENRGDTFYIMDLGGLDQSISNATTTSLLYDTNYAACYYPWVRILDTSTGKLTWVPPSVVLAGTIAFTDKVSHEWFAPAGLLRGGLSDVLEAKTRLTHDERDTLYDNRVNPIATFPGQGVVVWGQKTLQGKPSALDRVNVRRLLIKLKKFIASSTKFLVFEQNTAATRNRFLNIVNPFLEQVQQNSGLSAFRVVMDETNNTPDLIDRNILFGQIYIQPTRTAEFIILDFNIMPTGATFPE